MRLLFVGDGHTLRQTKAPLLVAARRGAMQVAPPLSRRPNASARAVRSGSAPRSTNTASLPDSSMVAGTSRSARSASTLRPVIGRPPGW